VGFPHNVHSHVFPFRMQFCPPSPPLLSPQFFINPQRLYVTSPVLPQMLIPTASIWIPRLAPMQSPIPHSPLIWLRPRTSHPWTRLDVATIRLTALIVVQSGTLHPTQPSPLMFAAIPRWTMPTHPRKTLFHNSVLSAPTTHKVPTGIFWNPSPNLFITPRLHVGHAGTEALIQK
jgi:hypothetical protein